MDKQELLIRATLTIYGLIHGCARIPHGRVSSVKSIIRYARMTVRNEISSNPQKKNAKYNMNKS